MKKGRKPAPDELALWRKVAERTRRLDLGQPFDPEIDLPPPLTPDDRPARQGISNQPPKSAARKSAPVLPPDLPDPARKAPVRMDRKAFGRMKRGRLVPEGRIDLHGMTLDRAHPALTRFILSAHASGKRLVLVITGKGKDRDEGGPIPARRGLLRTQVPQWLSMPPLASAVLQVSEAHVSHGGAGAYYVYLRRQRQAGDSRP